MASAPLGSISPINLVLARITFHNAVQLIASAGHNLAEPKPDDSHRSLGWDAERLAFYGVLLEGGFSVRVRTVEFIAELVAEVGTAIATIQLEGKSLTDSLRDLRAQMPIPEERRSFGFAIFDETLPDQKLIVEPLKLPALAERTELAHQYANAFEVLSTVCADEPNAAPIRTWPHHFDMATILPGGREGATIGVGLSPGDSNYAQPYWYVTPYPLKVNATEAGAPDPWHWHKEGFTGLVLPMSDLYAVANPASCRSLLQQSLAQCIQVAKRVIAQE